MNKCFALSSLLLLLASCGGTPTSSVNATEYFDALEASIKAGLKNDSIGFLCDTGRAKASVQNSEGITAIEIRPLAFDLRASGIHASTIGGVKASLKATTQKRGDTYLYAAGPSIPDILNDSQGIKMAPCFYVDESKLFIDLGGAGVVRTAISNALAEEYEGYSLPLRSHKNLEEYSEIEKYMPIDAKLEEYATTIKEELEKSYASASSSFAFTQENGVSAISFQTTSWSIVRAVLDREELQTSSIDVSSFFDQAEEKATLNRCRLDLEYDANGLRSFGIDVAFTFKEMEIGESFVPCGTWELIGSVGIFYGANAKPEDISYNIKKQCLQNEFTLPF